MAGAVLSVQLSLPSGETVGWDRGATANGVAFAWSKFEVLSLGFEGDVIGSSGMRFHKTAHFHKVSLILCNGERSIAYER